MKHNEWTECLICFTYHPVDDSVRVGRDWFGDDIYVCKWCVRDNPELYQELLEKYGEVKDHD